MSNESAASATNSSATSAVLQRTTNNDAAADSPLHAWIMALQHSVPGPLGSVAPPSQQQAPTLQAAPLLGINTGAVTPLQALLAAAHAPPQAGLQRMQPAAPQAHTTSAAQLLAQFSSFQTPPPQTAWGSGAATQLVPAQDLASMIRL
ncbi:hypothetical protein T484DRAFT_1758430, partial [Baffinella frigidus]